MDTRLIAWARRVKARGIKVGPARRHGGTARLPPLWLFADPARLPDPCPSAARLPRGLCGVILRHDRAASGPLRATRLAAGRRLARICRERRLALHVAGDPWLAQALGAGVHLRRGRRLPGLKRVRGRLTSSAHGVVELRRARQAGAAVFLSPCFATRSHHGAIGLGLHRWSAIVRTGGVRGGGGPVLALGGITGLSARALPLRLCQGAGAIGALAVEPP